MKKILLLVLPVMALCLASCEKNNENEIDGLSGDDVIEFEDPNFLKALLFVQEIDGDGGVSTPDYYLMDVDANKDGKITVNEAKKVLALSLHYLDSNYNTISFEVESMPEIKYFTSLEYLDCSYNKLTSLDVSNNTALKYLYVDENQLTSLDVSNNTALRELSCYDTQLTSLDLSNNTALEFLYCRAANQLTSLDLSNCTALETLACDRNQFTSLDVSDCTALTWLSCGENQLTSLDLSNNTALTRLTCFDTQLTSLDLSKCTKLYMLFCVDFNYSGEDPGGEFESIIPETKCPLESLKIYKYHTIWKPSMDATLSAYGSVIEYVE